MLGRLRLIFLFLWPFGSLVVFSRRYLVIMLYLSQLAPPAKMKFYFGLPNLFIRGEKKVVLKGYIYVLN